MNHSSVMSGVEPMDEEEYQFYQLAERSLYESRGLLRKPSAILRKLGVEHVHHFTSLDNWARIQYTGLKSLEQLEHSKWTPAYASDAASRKAARRAGLQGNIHLSFVRDHPMMHKARSEGRVKKFVVLQVDIDVVDAEGALFANMNTMDKRVNITPVADTDFSQLDTSLFAKPFFDLSPTERTAYQAEFLIPHRIDPGLIRPVLIMDEHGSRPFS